MNRLLPIAGLLLIAGCGEPREQAPAATNEAASAPSNATEAANPADTAKADLPSLEGSWNVTMISGSEARPLGITATLGGGKATLSSGCFRRAWTYTQKGNMVDFTTSPGGSSNCGGQAPSARQEDAYAALDGVNIAIFSQQGKRADLSGDTGTLTLERR
jgi:hypothetical protein